MIGESLPPTARQRLGPELCLLLGAASGVGSLALLIKAPSQFGGPAALALVAAVLAVCALRLEAHLGRRRFVLHFATERLRLERLSWAPSATRMQTIPFDDVTAVQVVQRPTGYHALLVTWRTGPAEQREEQRAVLIEHIRPGEEETLYRVWRMLHNAFGLKASEPAGG